MIGRVYLRSRTFFRGGLCATFRREVLRPKILGAQPMRWNQDNRAEVHLLLSSGDFLNGIWAIRSLYQIGNCRYGLCIHDDGSLQREQIALLKDHFPQARVIARPEADAIARVALNEHQRLSAFREQAPFAIKFSDFPLFCDAPVLIFLDSDILFFQKIADELEGWVAGAKELSVFNKDWRYGYPIELEALEAAVGFKVLPLINSGFGVIRKDWFKHAAADEWLGIPDYAAHPYAGRIEQGLVALTACRNRVELMPHPYDVHIGATRSGVSMRHYIGPIRDLMYREGLPLVQKRLLGNLQSEDSLAK